MKDCLISPRRAHINFRGRGDLNGASTEKRLQVKIALLQFKIGQAPSYYLSEKRSGFDNLSSFLYRRLWWLNG